MTTPLTLDSLALVYNADGLIPAIIQDVDSHRVLMLGYMNAEALERTVSEGRVTFWSRSRQEFWRKGDTSGHAQFVRSVSYDCDSDTLLLEVEQIGAACHTGSVSCFDDRTIFARIDVTPTSEGSA
jgi:phosphoribosyl-AMP cyclohydrolase